MSSKAIFCVFIVLSFEPIQVYTCKVSPPPTDVVPGQTISVSCTVDTTGDFVVSWNRGSSYPSSEQIYRPAIYDASGNVRVPKYVAVGFSVDDSTLSQVILSINKTTDTYIGYYWCACSVNSAFDYTYITVIDSELQCFASDSLAIDDPVVITSSLNFTGIANSLLQISDSSGNLLKAKPEISSSNSSQTRSLDYIVSSDAFYKAYTCNITLTNDLTNKGAVTIFSGTLSTLVKFSVRNISISPEDPQACRSDGRYCPKNVRILCKAEGYPAPNFQLQVYNNGTLQTLSASDYTTNSVGQLVIQCTASNTIRDTVYSTSANFTTNVTEGVYSPTASPSTDNRNNVALIVGLVVGLGGGLLLILIIIVATIVYKRQRRRTACCNLSQSSGENVETKEYSAAKEGNGTPNNTKTNNSNEQVVNSNMKTKGNDETILVDNNLYSGTKNAPVYNVNIDPSDGGYAALNEVGLNKKS